MYSLVFLICLANGQCITQVPEAVFSSLEQCEATANVILRDVDRRMAEGEMPPHLSKHVCHSWGEPA